MLAHYLEAQGVPTTQISLVRRHTEIIQPPRALWVPFEFGRPLGAPNEPAFQQRVLLTVLKLLEASEGPVLQDFPDDAPAPTAPALPLACPHVPLREELDPGDLDRFCRAFAAERAALAPWYKAAALRRQRTTVGLSRFSPGELDVFLCAVLHGETPAHPVKDMPFAYAMRFAADDLKAYYLEAIVARPGMATSDSLALDRWFWEDTAAGRLLLAIKEMGQQSEDRLLKRIAGSQIVPRSFAHLRAARIAA